MSDYAIVSMADAGEELNRIHAGIEGKMRSSVQDAIRAGEILSKVKERLPHGDFLPWIKLNCRFGQASAYKYMGLFLYQSKLISNVNLQEAYKQVETLEAQERKTDDQKARERVAAFVKTGQKPEGWRRGTDDALAEKEKARAESMKKWNEEMKAKNEERVQQAEKARPSIDFSEINKMVEQHTQALVKRQTFKESIRISHEGKDDPFVDAIMDYLETLADDNRRMEACYNIIKVCKGIANQLQSGKTP